MKNIENYGSDYPLRILAAKNKDLRFNSTSGGVVSTLIKVLLDKGYVNSAISFEYSDRFFEPRIIYNSNEYVVNGSIYHDINLPKFINLNIKKIMSPILVTALPCQVKPIRKILNKNGIDSIIVSLTCSSQLSKDATKCFLDMESIACKSIKSFKYRGSGWPGGINIVYDAGERFISNLNSKWMYIFHSQIFTLEKCYYCNDTFGKFSDISVADPWLERYLQSEKLGCTITMANTKKGNEVLNEMMGSELELFEKITMEELIKSQYWTTEKKYLFRTYPKITKKLRSFIKSRIYIDYFFKKFPKLHYLMVMGYLKILKMATWR
ncbi:coenzyme F420-reducing hydrogenase beta subunit [Methanococcus maripaludis]|uniref:Coenzyme F420-reducing hydrogenase beta subunit n=1 Tax=Methanococcus maripaludis TaxID=39152 RepID=A0A7J9NZI4_METMI|nr:Coenzyme F420 hydrogenase/dehydrogenase, beta subunit C-terminal domain [Methanococcus maripaludis]MBA2853112.1 coenzyme F420-reducing hydrogenase beta subunit [Methanococcus maripaludis]